MLTMGIIIYPVVVEIVIMTKFVWYNKEDGKFSDSWNEDAWGHQQLMKSLVKHAPNNWILIEYEVLQGDFEFCQPMRIA